MADVTSNTPISSRSGPPRGEYTVYFTVIFLVTLPLSTLGWARAALRRESGNRGPFARAWSQARVMAPMIFSA
ncbi:MAG: cytochrome PufQ [Pseudomonadota bacterium]